MNSMPVTAAEFDARFDAGEDMGEFFAQLGIASDDLSPELLDRLGEAARSRGMTRAALMHRWLTEKLDEAA